MPPPSVDLHSHTTVSDGLLSPRELVRQAAASDVDVLAVTDHDTAAGVPEAAAEAAALGLRLVPGMELSAHHGERGLHILAYFPTAALPRLETWQAQRRQARQHRFLTILDKLRGLGIALEPEILAQQGGAQPGAVLGRPHVARALVETGAVASMQQAFERYLARGAPAFVEDQGPQAADAIRLIHGLPGLAVVAHPLYDEADQALEALVELGLDGVEAYHGSHEPDVAAHFQRRADALGLLVTGGSDYHGNDQPGGSRLGAVPLPHAEWERLDAALAALERP